MGELEGKTVVLTGATSGIGRASALSLSRKGARLAIVCRDRAKGHALAAEIRSGSPSASVDVFVADLSKLAEVRRVAAELLERLPRIDVLVNNAGIVNLRRELTEDGLEATFATNHLAYYLLTRLLLERLIASAPARIVIVASDAHRFGRFDPDDLQSEKRYGAMAVYGKSKLANLLFTYELARRLEGSGVTVNALHPGAVRTGLGRNNRGVLGLLPALLGVFFRTPEKGAETSIWLASSPDVTGVSGKYFFDRREHESSPVSHDRALQRRLWDDSALLCGLQPSSPGMRTGA
jgi:NAD(P)-dependent dehydrogenase (short-subunit alcohol dehydrogenase family)